MSTRHVVHAICLLAMILLLPAANARAELAAWDQARVTALGKELVQASNALYETRDSPIAGMLSRGVIRGP